MPEITITGTPAVLEDFDRYPSKAQRVIVRAINRGIVAARTQIVRDVARDSGLQVSAVRKAISQRNATIGAPAARIGAGLKRLPLIDFGARGPEPSRGRGRGVSYKAATGGRGRIESAFIARMRSGHRGVFRRVGIRRLGIVELFGPSLGQVFAKYRASALARGLEVFTTTLDHELDYQKGRA